MAALSQLTLPLLRANYNKATSADQQAIAGVAGKTIRVYAIHLHVAASATITLKDGTSAIEGARTVATVLDVAMHPSTHPRYELTSGNDFTINQTAVQVSGSIWYTQGYDTGGQ